MKNYRWWVSNIKPFINLYNWKGKVNLTSINRNNYTSFEEISLVSLVVWYVDVDVKQDIQDGCGEHAVILESIKQSYMSKFLMIYLVKKN